jgi:uncharacterized protein YjbI with pentapeptide repeats
MTKTLIEKIADYKLIIRIAEIQRKTPISLLEYLDNISNLSGVNLSKKNLSYYNLSEMNLSQSNLSEICLMRANLSKADLIEAELFKAILNYAILKEANLIGADLTSADLPHADLTKANLTNAILIDANLSKANLTKTTLINAKLFKADLMDTLLVEANLSAADLSRALLLSADLTRANLIDANLTNANLLNANLSETNLTNTNLFGAIFKGCDLTNAVLIGADLNGVDFTDTILDGAIFVNVKNITNIDGFESRGAICSPKSLINAIDNVNLKSTTLSEIRNYYIAAEYYIVEDKTITKDEKHLLRKKLEEIRINFPYCFVTKQAQGEFIQKILQQEEEITNTLTETKAVQEFPVDIFKIISSYVIAEDIVNLPLIKNILLLSNNDKKNFKDKIYDQHVIDKVLSPSYRANSEDKSTTASIHTSRISFEKIESKGNFPISKSSFKTATLGAFSSHVSRLINGSEKGARAEMLGL